MFQNPHGTPSRSVLDHVAFPLLATGARRCEAEAEAFDLLRRFRLDPLAHQDFHSLSGGEAQRLMLARAAASRPALFLIDEPTAQLDLLTRKDVNTTIAALADPSTIVVIATHDEATRNMCTRVIDLRAHQEGPEAAQAGDGGPAADEGAESAPDSSQPRTPRGLRRRWGLR